MCVLQSRPGRLFDCVPVARSQRSNDDKCRRLFTWFTTIHTAELLRSTPCCQYKLSFIALEWRMFPKYFCLVYWLTYTTNNVNSVRNPRKLTYLCSASYLTDWVTEVYSPRQSTIKFLSIPHKIQPAQLCSMSARACDRMALHGVIFSNVGIYLSKQHQHRSGLPLRCSSHLHC